MNTGLLCHACCLGADCGPLRSMLPSPVLRNQLADLSPHRDRGDLRPLGQILASEIAALEADPQRLPWEDGLPDMLERWRIHVEGWFNGAWNDPRVTFVKYEDLRDNYDEVLGAVAKKFDWPRNHAPRPDRDPGHGQDREFS